jgi:hypothetical protein
MGRSKRIDLFGQLLKLSNVIFQLYLATCLVHQGGNIENSVLETFSFHMFFHPCRNIIFIYSTYFG